MTTRLSDDDLHLLKERIHSAVDKLVDQMTKGLPEDQDDLIRTQLTEQYRFWR